MADNVFAGQITDADIFNILHNGNCHVQSGDLPRRQVFLCSVSGDHHFGAETDTGQEHLHLRWRRILRFIQDNKGIVQCAPAHVGKRRHSIRPFSEFFRKLSAPMIW